MSHFFLQTICICEKELHEPFVQERTAAGTVGQYKPALQSGEKCNFRKKGCFHLSFRAMLSLKY